MTFSRSALAGTAAAGILGLATAFPIFAATTVVVTPSNQQGWSTMPDTTSGGAVNFIADATSPAPTGALQLTTTNTSSAKAAYVHAATADPTIGDPLASLTSLSYSTKQNAASFASGDASYQLITLLNGPAGFNGNVGFSTLVFEPYLNPGQGAVTAHLWQHWDVDAGRFWSTRQVVCSGGTVNNQGQTYTLAQINALCPSARVYAYQLDIGSSNPSYDVEADLFDYNGTVYDFELDPVINPGGGTCPPDCGNPPPPPGATPELDSLLLFGSGLSGLGGYAVMRLRARRRQ